MKGNLLKWNERLGWNYLYLAASVVFFFFFFWCFEIASSGEACFHYESIYHLHCSGEVKLAQVSVARCAVSQFPSQWASGDYLILWRWRMWPQISYPLMAFTRRGTQHRKKGNVFFRYISSSAPRRKNDGDYCHTVLESYFFCSNCWEPILSKCVCFCLYFWEDGECGFVCVQGIVSGPSFAFQLVNPTVGRVGCKVLSGQDLAPQSRIERGGDIQHSQ